MQGTTMTDERVETRWSPCRISEIPWRFMRENDGNFIHDTRYTHTFATKNDSGSWWWWISDAIRGFGIVSLEGLLTVDFDDTFRRLIYATYRLEVELF